jgi:hypothetical protein
LNLHLLTDSGADKLALVEEMNALQFEPRHRWSVFSEDELGDREEKVFGRYQNLRAFRRGHPCWRKITDPLLLGNAGEELILLDPDLYFPNVFNFEATPKTGLLLMWQRPNCLLPPEVVRVAMEAQIRLADHVDIGVAQWRAGQDLEWIDWLLGRLGGERLPRVMHIEAIVWAAIAMREGGGHLDPGYWTCWHRTQLNRMKRKLGVGGAKILRKERWAEMKCFHGGGEAKWWLPDLDARGGFQHTADRLEPGVEIPFVEFTRPQFERQQKARHVLRTLGYYRLLGSG